MKGEGWSTAKVKKFWQSIRLLAIPCGRTCHWNQDMGLLKLITERLMANHWLSLGERGW